MTSAATKIRAVPISADVEAKARRYLADGRVHLQLVVPDEVRALVSGSAEHPYLVRWLPRADWRCTCPAARTCAHIRAVGIVTSPCQGVTP